MTVLNMHKGGKAAIANGTAVYIGRGSMWGNPFVMGQQASRDKVCEQHREYLQQRVQSGQITLQDLASLYGKDLVCFCAPLRCHGDTLVEAAMWAVKELTDTVDSSAGFDIYN